ncbi:MAG: type II secretion system GspH family protein [Patescibacteria group bacterium]|nr:type II secretion system GspH family protein [Patescibacteria group bacterium]
MRLQKNKKAFSLIEMVVTIALVSMITVIVTAFLSESIKSYRMKRQSVKLEENAAQVMREFEISTRAANEIIRASNNELVFLRYFDLTSASPTQVRYFIDGNTFKIGMTQPVGSEPNVTYPSENEVIDLIIKDVVNTDLLFKYYDGSNLELAMPVNITDIRMVGLSISLDKNGNLPPAPITETTIVSLRNMKDNL